MAAGGEWPAPIDRDAALFHEDHRHSSSIRNSHQVEDERASGDSRVVDPDARMVAGAHQLPMAANSSTSNEAARMPSDALPALLALEERSLSQQDHQALASSPLKTLPNSVWRERVVMWMYSIADHLRESRSIVAVATSILDRYTAVVAAASNNNHKGATGSTMDSLRYEVASMTALFLAVRVAGSGNLSVQQLLSMRRHSKIQTDDIVKLGSDMVKRLSWKQRRVTPAHFLAKFVELLPDEAAHDVGNSAQYLIEMSICDACLSRAKPSNVALAALMNVLRADAPTRLEGFVDRVRKVTHIDAHSEGISGLRGRLHRLYSLSYDVHRPDLPHLVLESEDGIGGHDDEVVSNFHSSAAVRTISDDDLCGKCQAELSQGRKRSSTDSASSDDGCPPRLKRVKTDLHLSSLC